MKEKINVGYIGLGRCGMFMLDICVAEMADVNVVAVCDMDEKKLADAKERIEKKGKPAPATTTHTQDIFQNPDIDAVFVMTGWNSHIKLAIEAMRAGKYAAIEVGCAYDINECFDLVRTYEETGIPVMMLENCCYGRREMMALKMAKMGMFGEIIQCNGGYHHYLNPAELFIKKADGTIDENHYRLAEYKNRNCEQYPTHELGPISKVLNLNRGNRALTLTSIATKSRGIETYMQNHVPQSHSFTNCHFRQGDLITTMITCSGGEVIKLTLDTTLPRPYYSRGFTVRGTKGMCEEISKNMATFYFDGMEEGAANFNNEAEYFKKYDHPLHVEFQSNEIKGGHGGMDWLVVRAFVESVKHECQTPIDIYDTALWLAIGPLSEMSIARGGAAVDVPDFTKGKWFHREPALTLKYSLDEIIDDPDTPIYP